jgi:signal transduction histidine kinase
MKLLIINCTIILAIFVVFFIRIEEIDYEKRATDIKTALEEGTITVSEYTPGKDSNTPAQEIDNLFDFVRKQEKVNPYLIDGLSLRITKMEGEKKEVIYTDIDFDISENKKFLNRIYYSASNHENRLIISETKEFVKDNIRYSIYYQYNLSNSYNKMIELVIGLAIFMALMVILTLKSAKKGNQRLLEPLDKMTCIANKLTVNNLHSERINVEGTKNELKDLATVINKMLDRIEISYESQKQFVSDASHELRTPIAVIQGYVNLLDRWGKKDVEVLDESIGAIKNEAKSMQDLVEKLLFLSRHDKKTLKLIKTRFNMKLVVEDMVKETKLVVINRVINCNYLEDAVVYGDKQALKQAIRVFIDNAVKYTRENDEINISCQNVNGDCIITVSDTGIGMTRKDIDNIFERFYRSDHVRNDKINGHGLGLSIAKLIILGHTGRIKVRSQYTVGSSFIITLPNIKY